TDGVLFSGAMAISARGILARGEAEVVEAEGARRTGDAVREVLSELRPEQVHLLEQCAAYGESVKRVAQEVKRDYRTVLDELHALKALCGARLAAKGVGAASPWHPELSGE